MDETIIQVGNQKYWLRICIEPINSSGLGIYLSEERNMLVADKFIRSIVSNYGKHTGTLIVIHSIHKHVMS